MPSSCHRRWGNDAASTPRQERRAPKEEPRNSRLISAQFCGLRAAAGPPTQPLRQALR
jgi:hypothetical protein